MLVLVRTESKGRHRPLTHLPSGESSHGSGGSEEGLADPVQEGERAVLEQPGCLLVVIIQT
jgi:hypothetical protein